jgi:ferric-dicitrate binding protein FerR (iron transport regulator)
MKLEVTRDVVSDLWALSRSGDASPDSRALVDTFLAQDPSFSATLKESEAMNELVPHVHLSPEAERRFLDDARERARTKLLIMGGSVVLTAVVLLAAFAGAIFVFAGR